MTAPVPPPRSPFPGLELAGDWLLYAGSFLAVLFCVYYTLHARWWRSEAGWFLFSSSGYLAILLIFLSTVISKAIPTDGELRFWARIVIYGLSIPMAIWKVSMLHRAQKDGRSPVTLRTPLDVPPRDKH